MTSRKRLRYDPYADYYIVLGVSSFASGDEIQNAFRQRAKVLHPDRNPDQRATAQFQLLNEAYDVLSDPALRDEYNTMRQRAGSGPANGAHTSAGYQATYHGSQWRRVLGGLWSGPYRYVFMMLGIVVVANVAFIIATRVSTVTPPPLSTPLPGLVAQPNDPLNFCDPGAVIISPTDGMTVSGVFDLIGTTSGPYQVDWAAFTTDATGRPQLFDWHPLGTGKTGITRSVLISHDKTASLPASGRVRLRLVVTPGGGQAAQTCEESIILKTG